MLQLHTVPPLALVYNLEQRQPLYKGRRYKSSKQLGNCAAFRKLPPNVDVFQTNKTHGGIHTPALSVYVLARSLRCISGSN